MLLKNLIKNLSPKKSSIKIDGLAVNSNAVKKNYIFFAIRGEKINGEKFINKAINKGASVIVCSKKCKFKSNKIFIIKTLNTREKLSEIASKFYNLKPKNLIAVTGTNGKTSVTDLFYQILSNSNVPVASIGTLGIKFRGKSIKTPLTTPDIISLHKQLELIKKNKIDNVMLEASSHGLDQKRLSHIQFKAGIFTNFSQDHLDYHKTMKSYLNAKLILFRKILPKKSFIVAENSFKQFSTLKKISKKRKLNLINSEYELEKINKVKNLKLNLFQKKNLSMAIAAARLTGLKNKLIYKSLDKLKYVKGRMELVRILPNNARVIVDYAHTPDALSSALDSVKDTFTDNVSLVFGCGGDRDQKKRSLMAKIANYKAKKVYVTDDNPRSENPKKIRQELIKYINPIKRYNISNRSDAIKTAIINSEPNETILIAGKGHEDEQVYKSKIIFNSDINLAKKVKIKKKNFSRKIENFKKNKKIFTNIIKKNMNLKNFHGISIDSRNVKKQNLFLTIKGRNTDGRKFMKSAIKRGAIYIVSSNVNKKYRKKSIKVNNEITFLKKFALLNRKETSAKIIAITGSSGKTSLKNLTQNLLENFGKTCSSPKSYNNHFGVPLSLSNLSSEHKYGIFEIGMSKKNEIRKLSGLVQPHIAIITNIGEAHIENFKNIKEIARAKGEIIENVKKNGTVILNRDDKFFSYLSKKAISKNIKVITFGKNIKSDVRLLKSTSYNNLKKIKIELLGLKINLKAKDINIYNILASIALLKVLNLNYEKVLKSYVLFEPSEGRGKTHKIKRFRKKFSLIDESYNANPLSMKNAINNFNSLKKKKSKKYLILGDMLELGKNSKIFHRDLSKVINSSDIDKVFIMGKETLFTYKNLEKRKRGNIFQLDEDVDFTLKNIIANNDLLMIKGSNATGLNNITKKIIKGY